MIHRAPPHPTSTLACIQKVANSDTVSSHERLGHCSSLTTLRFRLGCLTEVFEAAFLCYFLQCPCCCLHSEGCNGNLPLYFFPGFVLISFAFDIKHGIVDPWEGLSSILVVTAWSKDDVSVGTEEKNVGILNKSNH